MQKKSQDFSMEKALEKAATPAAQQLLALLREENSDALDQLTASAGAGDYTQAGKILRTLLDSPQAQTLLEQLGR